MIFVVKNSLFFFLGWIILIHSTHSITSWERCRELIQHLPMNPSDTLLEFTVMSCGLYPFLEDHMYEFPTYLHPYCGRGVGMWQYPIQFSKYLNVIRMFKDIHTYVEIGTGAGGTFIFTSEFLRKYTPNLVSIGVDIQDIGRPYAFRDEISPYDGNFLDYILNQTHSGFIRGNVHDYIDYFPQSIIDLALIDGDHSYDGISHDFDVLFNRSRIMVFHDVVNAFCPGVKAFWQEMKRNFTNHVIEFVDQYPEYSQLGEQYLGIGVFANPLYFDCAVSQPIDDPNHVQYVTCRPNNRTEALYPSTVD